MDDVQGVPAAHTGEQRGCACEFWRTQIPKIDCALGLAFVHGMPVDVIPFTYCPYCGMLTLGVAISKAEDA